jgi:hypothetical protein
LYTNNMARSPGRGGKRFEQLLPGLDEVGALVERFNLRRVYYWLLLASLVGIVELTVGAVIDRDAQPRAVEPSTSIREVLKLVDQAHQSQVPVIDASGRLRGVLAVDVVRAVLAEDPAHGLVVAEDLVTRASRFSPSTIPCPMRSSYSHSSTSRCFRWCPTREAWWGYSTDEPSYAPTGAGSTSFVAIARRDARSVRACHAARCGPHCAELCLCTNEPKLA